MAAVGYDLDEIRQALGLVSIPAARERVKALRNLLEQRSWLRRGKNNELLVTPEGLNLLKRLEEVHQTGVPLRQAAARIMDELGMPQNELAALRIRLEEMRRLQQAFEARLAELEECCNRLSKSWIVRLLGLPRLPRKTTSDTPPQTKGH